MSHSDDKGLILPPAIAPLHVVIVPIWKTDEDKVAIETYINEQIVPQITNANLQIDSSTLGTLHLSVQYEIDRDDQKSP